MKRLIVVILLSVLPCFARAQDIKEDVLVRIVTVTNIVPNDGHTKEEFETFYRENIIPALEKGLPEIRFYMVKAARGENEGSFGVLWFAGSSSVYSKYHHSDGSYTEAGLVARKKIQPPMDQLNEIGSFSQVYTDWIIQKK